MEATESSSEFDRYKEKFKYYKKSRDFTEVVDLVSKEELGTYKVEVKYLQDCSTSTTLKARSLGLQTPSEWRLCSLPSNPGLLVIPNPFLPYGQHIWVKRCLVNYPMKPNICNLDAHLNRAGDGSLWPPEWSDQSNPHGNPAKKLKVSHSVGGLEAIPKNSLLYRLRWVTLGYHYDWTSKEYSEDRRSQFPDDLAQLSSFIAHQAGIPGFRAEAAIVNYYHLDSTLSGHTDHSERDLTRSLLSISFGQSAIFLIGGKTKQVEPVPILLRSGDVVIMSGESRLAYHGVPKIISPLKELVPLSLSAQTLLSSSTCVHCCESRQFTPGAKETSGEQTTPVAQKDRGGQDKEELAGKRTAQYCCCVENELATSWTDFMSYLSVSRINVNVRQVNPN